MTTAVKPPPQAPLRHPKPESNGASAPPPPVVADQPAGTTGGAMLKLGCALAAIAGIGFITGAVMGVAVDTSGVTAAGRVAGISAGGIFAVLWVAFIVNWYGKRTMPVAEEERPSPAKEKPKPSSSKQKRAPSKG